MSLATTAINQVAMDLGHDVARLKESATIVSKATLTAEHLQRVRQRFELKGAGAAAAAGAGDLVFEVCLKELSDEELTLSEAPGAAQAADLLTAKTKSSVLMKRKTEELLTLYSTPANVLFITDVNAGYVVGTEVLNPYRHPEAGGRGGGQEGTFDIRTLNEKTLSDNLLDLINNLLIGTTHEITKRMYCLYIVLTKAQWEQLIAPDGKTPVTQILIQKLRDLTIANTIGTLPDAQRVLLQIYETIDPDDGKGTLEYTNFTACLSTGTLDDTKFIRGAENQQWICCTLFNKNPDGQCLVSFGGNSPRMANSRVIPFVDEVLKGPLDQASVIRRIDFIENADLNSFIRVCGDLPESRLKLATAGASHKSGTDSNCRRFAREVVGDPVYRDRTIHITTGDGWFFKILSTQLNDMLGTIVGQGKKVILEYTPDKICNLYGYTEADSDSIQRICLGENEISRKNRIAIAVAKGKATRANNKIAEAAAAAAAAQAAGGAHAALVQERAQRIQRRNRAIIEAAEQAEQAAQAAQAASVEAAAAPAAAAHAAAAITLKEFNSKINLSGGIRARVLAAAQAEKQAEEAAENDEDEDEDVLDILSQKAIDQINDGINSRHGSPRPSFASPTNSLLASATHSLLASPHRTSAPQSQSGVGSAGGGSARKTRKHRPRKTRKRNRKQRKTRKV